MLSLHGLAEVVDRALDAELAGFRALGSRPTGNDAPSAVFLSGASRAHGFRAGLLESCIPVASGFAVQDPLSNWHEIDAVFEAICADGDDRDVVDALAEVFYPALRDAYDEVFVLASGPGDTFVRRTFRRCRDDVAGTLEEALALGATRAGSVRARKVRALLDEVGGAFGSLSAIPRRAIAVSPGQTAGGAA